MEESLSTPENHTSKAVHWLIGIGVTLALIIAGYFYARHQTLYPSTNDAYVHGNIIFVAPQIGGRLHAVPVHNYQFVHRGELLFQIDPAPYNAALQKARAAYKVATQANQSTSQSIFAASEAITRAAANLKDTQLKFKRTMTLVADGALPQQAGDNARDALTSAESALAASKDNMAALVAEQGAPGVEAPAVQEAAAALLTASLNCTYTDIYAPADGELGVLGVHSGSVVQIGQALVPLVQAESFWIAANYKETDLGRIKSGMPATVTIDMYADTTFHGRVARIAPASGSAFSLLPAENATGNWVKITQRFPVSIVLDKNNASATSSHPLRIGASATVTVDTVKASSKAP